VRLFELDSSFLCLPPNAFHRLPPSRPLRPPPSPLSPLPSRWIELPLSFDAQGARVLVVSGPSAVEPERRSSVCQLGRLHLVQTRIGTGFPTSIRSSQEAEDRTSSSESRESPPLQFVSLDRKESEEGRKGRESSTSIRLLPLLPAPLHVFNLQSNLLGSLL